MHRLALGPGDDVHVWRPGGTYQNAAGDEGVVVAGQDDHCSGVPAQFGGDLLGAGGRYSVVVEEVSADQYGVHVDGRSEVYKVGDGRNSGRIG